MNPEFRRNLLLELTAHRLIAMPLILLLIYAAAWLGGNAQDVSSAARYVMTGLLVLWGTRLAADAVLGEVAGRTWDSQRMSTIGPLAMASGKLLGSTIYVWYGAVLSIPALLYHWQQGPEDLLRIALIGLIAQAVSLFVSLLVQRLRPERLRFQVTASQLFGIAAGLLWWSILRDAPYGVVGSGDLHWYSLTVPRNEFLLTSGLVFLAWLCFGIYRLMRAELQFRCWPVGWTAFVMFCGVYVGGFDLSRRIDTLIMPEVMMAGSISRLLEVYLVFVMLVWVAAYVEPKGFVRLRRWGAALRLRDVRHILETTPAWLPGMLLAAAVGLALVVGWSLSPGTREVLARLLNLESLASFTVALFLFLVRDVGVVHLITLDGRKRRAHLTALVYLIVLYVLLPLVLEAADWGAALPIFLPYSEGDPLIITLPVLLQVAIIGGLLAARWKRVERSMTTA